MYTAWYLYQMVTQNSCARKEQFRFADLFKAFHLIESSHKLDIFLRKDLFSFIHVHHILTYHLNKNHYIHECSVYSVHDKIGQGFWTDSKKQTNYFFLDIVLKAMMNPRYLNRIHIIYAHWRPPRGKNTLTPNSHSGTFLGGWGRGEARAPPEFLG